MSRYKRYERYKDSGVEWIGDIPEHWELRRIKFIGTLYSGNGFKEELQGKEEGDYPFYKVSDINGDGKLVTFSNNYVDKDDIVNNRWNIIPQNSILFAKIGEALKKNHRKINESSPN
jgi:type I restriction enzyme S subunit